MSPPPLRTRLWRVARWPLLAVGVLALLVAVVGGGALLRCYQQGRIGPPERVVRDVTQLVRIDVDRVVAPRTTAELQELLRRHEGPVSIGGGRFSMGGQIGTDGALFLDMREMDDVLALDPAARTVRVEAGITWRKIQEAIDPHDLSLKIMQSYANFTVGGSLSVNAHGRYVNEGPLVHSVRALDLVLADGTRVHTSREQRPDLFFAAIGGYGAVGVIAEVELQLEDNAAVERTVERMSVDAFPAWFDGRFRPGDDGAPPPAADAVFFNADLYPPAYDDMVAITFSRTDRPVTVPDRLQAQGGSTATDRLAYWWVSEAPLGKKARQEIIDRMRLGGKPVVWRNYEASYDAYGLEPASRERSTYVLQEYFVPVARFSDFAAQMGEIFNRHGANVVNVSIRHASADPDTLLTWAPEEVFAFVVYYKQGTSEADQQAVGVWTRELIDAVIAQGGTYYLPYQLHATDAQFHAAYPRAAELFALKQRLDPTYKLRNRLLDRYLPSYPPAAEPVADLQLSDEPASDGSPVADAPEDAAPVDASVAPEPVASHAPPDPAAEAAIARRLAEREGYLRPEDQTFLTLPEWYIVYSADELGAHLQAAPPSSFPWFASICQFCELYGAVSGTTAGRYARNTGYHTMIWVIGSSYVAEYALRGAWERTVGRLFEGGSGGAALEAFHADVSTEYGAFIHHTPWYAFPWHDRRRAMSEVTGDGSLRDRERRLVVGAELLGKGVWGGLLGAASQATYGEEPDTILAWVRLGDVDPTRVPGVSVVEDLGEGASLIAIPRYEPFSAAVPALASDGVRFVEIAGGRTIVVQVIAPSSWDRASLWGDVTARWPILTEPGTDRVALEVPVGRLHEVIPALKAEPIRLEHVYDY